MSDKGRRPIKRVTRDKKVQDIGSSIDEIPIVDIKVDTPEKEIGNKVIIHIEENDDGDIDDLFNDYLDSHVSKDDWTVIELYTGIPSNNSRSFIDKKYQNQLRKELIEFPFWISVTQEDKKELEKLYLEYHVVNLQLQAYNMISEVVPERDDTEDMILEVMNKRMILLNRQDDISDKIGKIVTRNLQSMDNDIIYVPEGFTDELDFASTIHQKILLNSNTHNWKKYRGNKE